ncbi:aminoglycoside phosphotransferase family protein [Paenibacillus mesophilus]|uniref:aminoglycoside phosphotransferase family protein n=1 Tax=Paenibacillus mesophilus TaxID=2582849 RepID=UPI00308270E5
MVWLKQNSGLKGKIPVPVATKNGAYKCEDEDGIYLLYEYIEGETIGDKDLTGEQICSLSAIIAELHSYSEQIPVETSAIKEDFTIPFLPTMKNFLEKDYEKIPDDVRALIHPHLEQIQTLIGTLEMHSEMKNSQIRMALCHTDLHNWNLMQSDRELILIDWEGLRLAPVEADLMFLVDQPYYDDFLNIYRKVHQHFAINPDILQFYQYRRKLEDIWEFLEQLLFDHQDAQERTSTLNCLMKELNDIG